MTEIALRTYTQEVKELIDHAHFDEAIAHCQHILETFPRHIETYRLLGKAFLEQGRHGDAADVFQRVLSAIPEDWLSHVAMAIVREDESNLDMAIWHMERAYEVNPSNPTVQQEVRRLRGRRDGVEPPKLRLTRSALARMYIKGGLYGQAIAEIRSALTEDPDRPDLQILLASALYDSGAVQEAADICNTLLQKLPYCMEANRILGLVLQASNKNDDAEKLFQRIASLDPYIDLEILKKEKRITEHPGQEVALSRLEYEGQEKTVRTKQPSWASSLGLKIEETPQRQAIPDWLAAASQQPPAFPSASQGAAAARPAAAAPSWLDQTAAAMSPAASKGPGLGAPARTTPPPASPPIARTATGELPDWIQRQAMPVEPPPVEKPMGSLPDWLSASSMPTQPEPAAPATSDSLPDWLSSVTSAPAAPSPVAPSPVAPTTGGALPDWIKTSSLSPEQPKEKISDIPDWLSAPPPPSMEALPSSSLPEWTKTETKTSPLGVEPNNIPDWLSSSQPTSAEIGPEPEWLKAAPAAESVPEWMKGVTPSESPAAVQPPSEDVPDWLRETSAPASKPVEIMPEWMRGETPSPLGAVPAQPTAKAAPGEDIPEWMKPEPSEMPVFPPSKPIFGAKSEAIPESAVPPRVSAAPASESAVPDWMSAVSPEPAAPAVQPSEAELIPEANLPDWLQGVSIPPAPTRTAPLAKTPEPIVEASLPDWLNAPAPTVQKPIEFTPQAVTPTLAEVAPEPEPLEMAPETAPEIALPDWLKDVPAPASAPVESVEPAEAPAEPIPMAELPDWLKGGPASQAPAQAPTMQPVPEKIHEPSPAFAPPAPPPIAAEPVPSAPARPAAEAEIASVSIEPGPAHVTPTTSDGIDLPEWLVTQLQGKPKETSAAPAAEKASGPLPDWLKPAESGSSAQPVVDWDKAASQPLPTAPVDATRPATGISTGSSEKPAGGSSEIPAWLDKSKPTGSDTVARWLDRRLKTSTLSSLDEASIKGGSKPAAPAPAGRSGTGTQLPTWLDSQKPGGSDTVVRWMDKRETGSLRKTPTATFSSVSKSTIAARGEKAAPPVETPPKSTAAAPTPASGIEDTVTSKRTAMPGMPTPVQPVVEPSTPVFPQKESPQPPRQPAATISPPKTEITPPVRAAGPAEEEDEGAFVPPPEWLQKALGTAVAEVPPIPKKQTGGLVPGTVSPVSSVAAPAPAAPRSAEIATPVARKPAAIHREPLPVEESAPAPVVKTGSWVPLTPTPIAPAAKVEKAPKKVVRKKTRKLTDVESEALIREARVYLETDLQKASEAYQQVIANPDSAEVVVGDLTTYLEQDPASPQLWNLLGDACSRAGRLQDAYRAYAEALRRM